MVLTIELVPAKGAGPFQEAKAGAFAYGADAQERVFNLPR
jgi:hypothetical protein